MALAPGDGDGTRTSRVLPYVSDLLEALRLPDDWRFLSSLRAINEILCARAVPDLCVAYQRRPWWRAEIAACLGSLGAREAVPTLRWALGDPDIRVAAAAATALGRINARRAGSAILACLQGAADPHLRYACTMALAELGSGAASGAVAGVGADPNPALAHAGRVAWQVLRACRLDARVLRGWLLAESDIVLRRFLLVTACRRGIPDVAEAVGDFLVDSECRWEEPIPRGDGWAHPSVEEDCLVAASELGRVGEDPAAIELLRNRLVRVSARVGVAAVRALAGMGAAGRSALESFLGDACDPGRVLVLEPVVLAAWDAYGADTVRLHGEGAAQRSTPAELARRAKAPAVRWQPHATPHLPAGDAVGGGGGDARRSGGARVRWS